MGRITCIVIFLFSLCGLAAGQDAHYTYPFSLECPEGVVSAGETISIGANFEGGFTGDQYSPTYNWSTSGGTIVSGQGTPKISLSIAKEEIANVHVSLNRSFIAAHYPMVQRDATCAIVVMARPSARMTDEFRTGGNNCEEGFARLDSFFTELGNDPSAEGVIVLYGDTRDMRAAARRELQLLNHFTFRRFARDRVAIMRGVAKEGGTAQFWLVPAGADRPEVEAAPAVAETPPTAPYLYAADYADGVPGCLGHLFDIASYAGVLKALPGSRGRLIINESSRVNYYRRLKELIAELAENGVPRSKITPVYKYVRPDRALENTELWVIPR